MTTSAARPDLPRGDVFDPLCPTRRLLDRVGGKWVVLVVTVLSRESPTEVRFADLERRMPGVSHKMLSQTLQSLARDGLVTRRVEPSVPPRVFYGLTPLGLSLDAPLQALREWAEEHMSQVDAHRGAGPGRERVAGSHTDGPA